MQRSWLGASPTETASWRWGMVSVADGTKMADERLQRVLTADPGTGVMRHADAGYDLAIQTAKERGVDLPLID